MSFVRNFPIGRKFTWAFGIISVMCIGLAVSSFFTLRGIAVRAYGVRSVSVPSIADLATMRLNAMSIRRSELAVLLCATQDCTDHYKMARQQSLEAYRAAAKDYEPLISTSEEREVYQQFSAKFGRYVEATDRAMAAFDAGQPEVARSLLVDPAQIKGHAEAMAAADKNLQVNVKEAEQDSDAVAHAATRANWISMLMTLAIVVIAVLIGAQLNRFITPRVRRVMAMAQQLAAKDLTVQVRVTASDELGRMGDALNGSIVNIREVLRSVARSADTLSAAATEISASAAESADNAKNQSSMTSQIASAAQEMTATIGEISSNAESAAMASRASAETAASGGQVMQAAADTMEKIAAATTSVSERITSLAHRSEEIGSVVNVIQEISEQTNLLALNAAIEAARAGEHGRGFAVVAGEVRRLAERTRTATQEIAGTIQSIQEESRQTLEVMQNSRTAVESGMEETARARQSLEAIIESSKQVEHQIQLIASAATEQTAASGEISQSAGQISHLAEQNTQGAEQAVGALQDLMRLASDLDLMIHQFKLEGDQKAAPPPVQAGLRTAVLQPAHAS